MGDVVDANTNEIILTIGRMNPPTTGHMELIRVMVKEAVKKNIPKVFIILSGTEDKEKNPFSCQEKIVFLEPMIERIKQEEETPNIGVEIVCMNDQTISRFGKNPILKCTFYILSQYGFPREGLTVNLVIGEDRQHEFNWIGKTLAGCGETPVDFNVIALSRPVGAISATEIRNLSLEGNRKDFIDKMMPTGIPEDKLIEMFETIPIKFNVDFVEECSSSKKAKSNNNTTRKRKRGGRVVKRWKKTKKGKNICR